MKKGDIARVLVDLEKWKDLKPCMTARVQLEENPGSFCDFPDGLAEPLTRVLNARGIQRLYSHQGEAYRRLEAGEDVVIVTPTASGKTLCYNLPVLDRLLKDPRGRALYIFPTKALAQDQRAELESLVTGMGTGQKVYTYDGDTPADIRRKVRTEAQVVITNPDMLHTGILPHHTRWNRFFGALAFIVVDEMHTYRGVFGSHMVNVLRRLRRVCRHYGSQPKYAFCSATIANPKDLAGRLLEGDPILIERSGAPTGEKIFYFVNPPVIQKELGLRASPKNMSRKIAERFLREGVSTIVFARSRLNVEILTKYLKDRFRKSGLHEDKKIRGYRGGYLPNKRREIERGLRAGEIKGVVSTNALELGVDIGSLDACILCGYPGSIASTWQRVGRAGRRSGLSCAVLVAGSTPLDQFIIRHPEYFFGKSPEHARVNPDNLSVLVSHIKCAAFELPFRKGERFGEPELEEILDYLAEKRVLRRLSEQWFWAEDAYPADQISLRSISGGNFLVVDRSCEDRIVAEVDHESAPLTVYPGAIYLVESLPFQVEELDYVNRKAYVTPVKADYYTEAVLHAHLRILETFVSEPERKREGRPSFHEGEVHVVNHIPGYKKLRFYSSENLGYGEISLPDQEMHTSAFWISVGPQDTEWIRLALQDLLEAMAGAGYAMQHMASFLLMCEAGDLGRAIGDPYRQWFLSEGRSVGQEPVEGLHPGGAAFQPTLFLYDMRPGGVGLSSMLFSRKTSLLEGTLSLIEGCSCERGCPSCVGPSTELGAKTKENACEWLRWMISGKD